MAYHVAYSAMGPQRQTTSPPGTYRGSQHFTTDRLSPITAAMQAVDFIRCDSMDIANDPRFFTGNVIDKRLAAFGGLAVVSGLLVQNAIDQSFSMRKDLNFTTLDGWAQTLGFTLLVFVLFSNMLSTYVGVAQPFHTYRLMTAGPTGFEMAAAYYLNPEIVYWRHLTIKLMLWSMPLYLLSSGFRFVAKFPRDLTAEPHLPSTDHIPLAVRLEQAFVLVVYLIAGRVLFIVHRHHSQAFQKHYDAMCLQSGMGRLRSEMQGVMMPRTMGSGSGMPPEV